MMGWMLFGAFLIAMYVLLWALMVVGGHDPDELSVRRHERYVREMRRDR